MEGTQGANLKALSGACLVEAGNDICVLFKTAAGDHQTPLGVAASVTDYEKWITSMEEDDEATYILTQLTSFFPVRHKLSNFLKSVRGMLEFEHLKRLVVYETTLSVDLHPNKTLTETGNQLFREYTGSKTAKNKNIGAKLNQLLATDMISDSNLALFAKELKACVGWQTPKWKGTVYRAAWHSPLEVFMMAFKKCFYTPAFTSTSIDPDLIEFDAWDDVKQTADRENNIWKAYHNVILEIDTSEFPNFTTILQLNQTDEYYTKRECLISCYNIFEWVGYRRAKIFVDIDTKNEREIEVPVISLRVVDYVSTNDLEKHCVKGPSSPIPEEWIQKRGSVLKSRESEPEQIHGNFQELCASYARNGGKQYPLDWLNAEWDKIDPALRKVGEELDGKQFRALEEKQEQKREAK